MAEDSPFLVSVKEEFSYFTIKKNFVAGYLIYKTHTMSERIG